MPVAFLAAITLSVVTPAIRVPQSPIVDVPFEVTGGRVYIDVKLAGRTYPMILDSGAGVTLIDTALAREIGAKTGAEIPVGGAGDQAQRGLLLQDTTVEIGGGKAKSNVFLGLNLRPLATFEGRIMHGIVGSDLFNRYVVQVDYPAKRVRLFNPTGFRYAGKTAPTPMRLFNMLPQVDLTVDLPGMGETKLSGMIDTGAGGGITFTAMAVEQYDLGSKFPAGPVAPLSGGVGGMTQGRLARVAKMKLGGTTLHKPVGVLTLSSGGVTGRAAGYDVLIGAEILRRFVLTFDYSRKQIFFEPTPAVREPFGGDRTGLLLKADGPELNTFVVFATIQGSPAAEAGILANDEVSHIDGAAIAGLKLDAVRRRFRSGKGPWRLTIRRGSETLECLLKPRELV